MELIIGNVPHNVTLRDLVHFAGPFAEEAHIDLVRRDKVQAPSVHYGLLRIPSERQARKAMRKLNGRELAGQSVEVREFVHRVYSNDRRAVNWRKRPWTGVERRLHDRRIADDTGDPTPSQEFRKIVDAPG